MKGALLVGAGVVSAVVGRLGQLVGLPESLAVLALLPLLGAAVLTGRRAA